MDENNNSLNIGESNGSEESNIAADSSKEQENTGYTGEYGNSVEGDYQDHNQSVYRYSYKDGNGESTHSGDYYENKNEQGNSRDAVSQENTQGNGQAGQGYQYGGYQNSGNQGGYQNNPYQNNAYQNNAYQNPGYQNQGNVPPKKEKGQVSFGKKVLIAAACAVVFGLVAGVCFNGVNYISQKFLGTPTEDVQQLDKTTVGNQAENKESTTKKAVATAANDVSSITEQCMPAVVAITSTTQGADYYDLFGQYYQGRDTTSCGSGFIIAQNDKELLIATNNHVIDSAKTISVQFIDGEIYEAVEKGADSSNDLAVIAVKVSDVKKSTMEQIKIADIGNSDDTKVGEMVIAIGNALGYGQSVTVGYISAKDREITESSEDGRVQNKIKAIQTDAAINPGNSGGALINMQGQVIGINSAKIANSSVEGVGYAIPVSVATPIIDELMNREVLNDDEKGYLGITGKTVSQEAVSYNVPYGVHVQDIAKGGAAEKAGIKANDIITAVNKMEVTTMESLQEKINSYRKGTKVEITLQRSNNGKYEEKKVTVTLQGAESLESLPDDNSGQGSGTQDNDNNGNNNEGRQQPYDGNDDGSGSFWDFFR
ncbi:PDZ domain-containing protein [bacterium D16-51]|nr:PDZ domain-containing protein [bacterium D16-59]RKI57976.1 PDZ domain-containing protein [bacterium D16-51]